MVLLLYKSINIMKKTATSKYPANLPISRNAYKRFINRIISVFADDPTGMSEMIAAFDSYLADPASPINFINPSMRVAFSFLRQDIDVAIERSRRARQRAVARKSSATPSIPTTPESTTSHIPATPPKGTTSPAHAPSTTPECTSSPSHVSFTTPEGTTSPAIEAPVSTTQKEESSATTTSKQDSTTPKQNTTTPHHHHRKNTRNTPTQRPSRHTSRKRKLKLHKPGQ